jgi:hypothetical protein
MYNPRRWHPPRRTFSTLYKGEYQEDISLVCTCIHKREIFFGLLLGKAISPPWWRLPKDGVKEVKNTLPRIFLRTYTSISI